MVTGRILLTDMADRPAEVPSTTGQTDLDNVADNQGRMRFSQTWWSDVQATVTITTTAGDLSLPSVTVSGIPGGVTLKEVVAIFKFREIEDTSGSANEIQAGCTPAIQVKESCAGTYTDAITVIDATLVVPASTRGPGDVWMGNIDVKAEVDEDDTYDFQFDQADAVGNNLILRDVQCGLRVTWQV